MTPGSAPMETASVRRVLRVCAVALVVLIAVQAMRYVGARRAALPEDPKTDADQASLAREGMPEVKEYDAVVEEEHFGKKPKPPRLQLFGIIGDHALIGPSDKNANLQKVDDKLPGDHVLVEVGADYVVVEREGKRQTLKLFGDPLCPSEKKPQPQARPGPEAMGSGPGANGPSPEGPPEPQAEPARQEEAGEDHEPPPRPPVDTHQMQREMEEALRMMEGARNDARRP